MAALAGKPPEEVRARARRQRPVHRARRREPPERPVKMAVSGTARQHRPELHRGQADRGRRRGVRRLRGGLQRVPLRRPRAGRPGRPGDQARAAVLRASRAGSGRAAAGRPSTRGRRCVRRRWPTGSRRGVRLRHGADRRDAGDACLLPRSSSDPVAVVYRVPATRTRPSSWPTRRRTVSVAPSSPGTPTGPARVADRLESGMVFINSPHSVRTSGAALRWRQALGLRPRALRRSAFTEFANRKLVRTMPPRKPRD